MDVQRENKGSDERCNQSEWAIPSCGRGENLEIIYIHEELHWTDLTQTGYNPRVLIFSTAKDAPRDVPLTILTEHSFGVRGLAFSSNSQYLATLGDINDAFLFVWAINLRTGAAKLHSTNKCTSFVRDMCWMGQTLITYDIARPVPFFESKY